MGLSNEVIGTAGKCVQHQQKTGNRENITVIVTICADGTSMPPAVIFMLKDMMGEKRRGVLMGSILLYTTMKIPTVT